ncbi:MAG: helix-turn-helix transcriptional regulator [Saprospiraceae bacterium]|nr:helix-turn-helix transcriptional regulator [Saprospiraceae bacterium]
MATAFTINYKFQSIKFSEREVEVLYLIAYEFKNREIAKMIFISEHTVDTYRKKLLVKLKARNSAGLVRRAYEERIFPMAIPKFLHGVPKEIAGKEYSNLMVKSA